MTVSYFEALESQIPAVEGRRMQDAALAALYPHTTREGGRKLWGAWTAQIDRVARAAAVQTGALFTVDGKPVGLNGLKKWMRQKLGKRAEVA